MVKKRFEFLEHTADIYIASYGKDFKEALENAAAAFFETMTNIKEVKHVLDIGVEAEGHDKESLLYDWLEKLLIIFEVEGVLLSGFKILDLEHKDSRWKLKAKVSGEPFDSSKHLQKVAIKAVTYHRMEVIEEEGSTTLKFILDI